MAIVIFLLGVVSLLASAILLYRIESEQKRKASVLKSVRKIREETELTEVPKESSNIAIFPGQDRDYIKNLCLRLVHRHSELKGCIGSDDYLQEKIILGKNFEMAAARIERDAVLMRDANKIKLKVT